MIQRDVILHFISILHIYKSTLPVLLIDEKIPTVIAFSDELCIQIRLYIQFIGVIVSSRIWSPCHSFFCMLHSCKQRFLLHRKKGTKTRTSFQRLIKNNHLWCRCKIPYKIIIIVLFHRHINCIIFKYEKETRLSHKIPHIFGTAACIFVISAS